MNCSRFSRFFAFLAVVGFAASAQAASFVEIARFDVGAASADSTDIDYIGNNPTAVAWDGGQLYVAGFNNGGANGDQTAIIEVTNAAATGVNAATFGPAFGALGTPLSRGYSGLDLQGGVLAAAYDDGAADPNGITAFDASNNTLSWAKNARGGSGVGHDPGFNGVDSGVAWPTFGSGRRSLQDTATGADIYTTADGMIITDFGGSFWRDIDFDAASGDAYTRRANDLLKVDRTGGNSGSVSVLVDTNENGPFVNGQNLDFMDTAEFGSIVVYNDRPTALTGQSFGDVVKVIDASGAAVNSEFFTIGGYVFPESNGYYDFDFDSASQTLALLDFTTRNVHIFSVVPEPSTAALALLASLAGFSARRR